MLSYIYSWFYPEAPTKKQVVYDKDLLRVKLKPVNPVKPAPNFTIQSLRKEELENILGNLKKTNINPKQTYEPRHPVLREILKYNNQ